MNVTTTAKWVLLEAVIVGAWVLLVVASGLGTTGAIVMLLVMNIVPLSKLCETAERRSGRSC